ncbi:hypothetical protein LY78DRAFT_650867 [Colletotrichum sublineola]|nr:hypothetical protein LY78DRAFT_650867 [Colletotrichum sublineola]
MSPLVFASPPLAFFQASRCLQCCFPKYTQQLTDACRNPQRRFNKTTGRGCRSLCCLWLSCGNRGAIVGELGPFVSLDGSVVWEERISLR